MNMRTMKIKSLILIIAIFLATSVSAEKYVGYSGKNHASVNPVSGKTGAFDCTPSASQIDININNIRARILAGGDFWWDGVETAKYEVPKVDPASGVTPVSSLFTGALWFTGLDNGGNLKCASQTYRNQGHDFYTGPLSGLYGDVNFDVCKTYDEHFEVFATEISELIALYNAAGGNDIPSADIPENVLKWPGKGNPYYLENETDKYYNEGSLAPFFDVDGNNIYDPRKGDYPIIGVKDEFGVVQPTYADQMIFWVINDNGQIHGRTGGAVIGVQVNCLAFAYATANALNDMTFYTFEIIKKSPNPLFETYMGIFVDPDLGDATDDFIGCDTVRDIGYVYNANAIDAQYGPNPPITAIDFFEGPLDDNGNQLGLSSFVYFNNTTGPQSDPDVAAEFRNYQTSRWADGLPVVYSCDARTGTTPFSYVYPGNPANPAEMSEVSCSNAPADRRFVQNSGPFTLQPGDPQRITIGALTVFPDNYNPAFDRDVVLGPPDDLAQNLFDNYFDIVDGPDAPTLAIRELKNKLVINLVNEKGSNNFGEMYAEPHPLPNNGVVTNDSLYRFQGYMVYQTKVAEVTASDLTNPEKAVLIYQSDIEDDISKVFNYEDNGTGTGTYNAVLRVDGNNTGINKTIEVTTDAFATGDNALVNNKPYYFTAIAYAYADYNPYPTTQGLPALDVFLQGRNNFKIYSAIPHAIDSRANGTELQAETGDPLQVYRYEGRGNGGKVVELSEATENDIITNGIGFKDVLEYKLGADPLKAKVIDPLKLQNVNFELRFESYSFRLDTQIVGTDTIITRIADVANTFADSSFWKIFVTNESGTPIDTIEADREFNNAYEQVIEDYGISVSVNIPKPKNTNLLNSNPVYSVLSSELVFDNIDKPWLSFIADDGFVTPNNWIRAGSSESQVVSLAQVYDAHQYDNLGGTQSQIFYDPEVDQSTMFETSILESQIAPYCLASNYANPGFEGTNEESSRPQFLYGPAFRWEYWDVTNSNATVVKNPKNNLDKLVSVTIVLTSDQSKWSDCVVFETGDDILYTADGTPKGALRSGDIGYGVGKGKFPGYAINLETGQRLNIAFGEASSLSSYNGVDMVFNPTSDIESSTTTLIGTEAKLPLWGGRHYVYVFNTPYDNGNAAHSVFMNNTIPTTVNTAIPTDISDVYDDIIYTFIPIVEKGYEFFTPSNIPTTARINININQPFEPLFTGETLTPETNDSLPRYRFSTVGKAPLENQTEVAESALDNIRVVPNPYYAYSAYEQNQIDNVVKIIGLPDKCEISIFSLDGKLVRKFNRAVGTSAEVLSNRVETTAGQVTGQGINLDNSLTWDLNNSKQIPIGSGTYIIHVNAFDLGEKVTKAVVFMRPTDVSNF